MSAIAIRPSRGWLLGGIVFILLIITAILIQTWAYELQKNAGRNPQTGRIIWEHVDWFDSNSQCTTEGEARFGKPGSPPKWRCRRTK